MTHWGLREVHEFIGMNVFDLATELHSAIPNYPNRLRVAQALLQLIRDLELDSEHPPFFRTDSDLQKLLLKAQKLGHFEGNYLKIDGDAVFVNLVIQGVSPEIIGKVGVLQRLDIKGNYVSGKVYVASDCEIRVNSTGAELEIVRLPLKKFSRKFGL